MNDPSHSEPLREIELSGSHITLLGTAHVSRVSAERVRTLLESGAFDAVAVELCPSRYDALMDPQALSRMDLFKVLREGKGAMVAASLALGAYQQRLADQLGIEPGAEQRAAVRYALDNAIPVLLIDREIGVTLRRIASNVGWFKRFTLFSGLLAGLLSKEEVSEAEVERLKEGDILETTFAEFAEDRQDLFVPLIAERDRYMAAKLQGEIGPNGHRRILVVIGAGHLKGTAEALESGCQDPLSTVIELEQLPSPSRWPKILPWVVVALICLGFAAGFYRSPEFGLSLMLDWILINGGLSALGALIAGAHPLTVVAAFLAAPVTSLNPTIGAGMVTAAVEIYLRKPEVGDFSALRHDTTSLTGWWKNRVSRTLLVFLLSTLGSALGTYIAGFRILDRLAG